MSQNYKALITAMEEAKKLGAKKIVIRGDSELIIKQMKGEYRVKHPDMKVLYDQAKVLIATFDQAKIEHNLRHKNELADLLANLAMDRKADVTEVPGKGSIAAPSPLDEPSVRETKAGDRFGCDRCGCRVEVQAATSIRGIEQKDFICQCGAKMTLQE